MKSNCFTASEEKIIRPEIVHKTSPDDVLLLNYRHGLPSSFETTLSAYGELQDEDKNLINKIYSIEKTSPTSIKLEMKGIPNSKFTTHTQSIQLKNIAKEATPIGFIPENMQNSLLKATGLPIIHETERELVEKILNKIESTIKNPELILKSNIDINHYYFYAKRHEHVPGMMLMEIARQAFYVYFHVFRDGESGESEISIRNFKCDFKSFAESSYPLRIHVNRVTWNDAGKKNSNGVLRADFYQRDTCISTIEVHGIVTNKKLFSRLRKFRPLSSEHFKVVKQGVNVDLLLINEDFSVTTLKVREIATKSLIASSEKMLLEKNYYFIARLGETEKFTGEGSLRNLDDGVVYLDFKKINPNDETQINNFIKHECQLI